ncbi:unnamed protein product [Allacma fusca]|uniref:Gustatory receptor n=1 Tax=Allacma fusca TaxID=39272 RepID=A0A8J2J882_9HEXA|nr:unnamed protein product [Allacma fusca]
MLPVPAFEYYKKIILFASYLHLFPYCWKWDQKQRKFVIVKTLRSQILYWTQLGLLLLYQLFIASRSWKLGFDSSIPLKKKFAVQYMIFTFIGMDFNILNTYVNSEKFPLLINSFVEITERFGTTYGRPTSGGKGKEKDKVSRSISLMVIPCLLLVVANILGALRRPESPLLLTSLAAEPRKLPLAIRLAYAGFHGYLQCLQYTMPEFNLLTVICYVDALLPMIKRLCFKTSQQKCPPESPAKTFSENEIYHFYHELSTLQIIFNACYSYWALGTQTFLTVFCISNIFQAGALNNIRGILAGLFQVVLIQVIFKHMATIYESSALTLQSWMETSGTLFFKKFTRACKPFRVVVGSFYFADYTLILTMFSIISTNSASFIVAYKDA